MTVRTPLDVQCPKCFALVGARCVTLTNNELPASQSHASRVKASDDANRPVRMAKVQNEELEASKHRVTRAEQINLIVGAFRMVRNLKFMTQDELDKRIASMIVDREYDKFFDTIVAP